LGVLLEHGSQIYATVYFGVILAVAVAEAVVPARAMGASPGRRWLTNFSLTMLGMGLVRLSFPLFGVAWAIFCAERGWGLLHQVEHPAWLGLAFTVVALDLAYYTQHYLLHRVPLLWRLHRTHHSDLEYDFSTGVRFHPFEAIFTTLFAMASIAVLGAPPAGVMLSQILAAAVSFVEHANVCLPARVDRVVRLLFVTPNMHRVHHSVELDEGNSNFSNMFSFWDRLFGTYITQPAAGHDGMRFGLMEVQDTRQLTLPRLLSQPFEGLAAPPAASGAPSSNAADTR
jgi:sterol desaturase/sphingolipid hydroxylase (fatty acid hydroxylase superfamily)